MPPAGGIRVSARSLGAECERLLAEVVEVVVGRRDGGGVS